MESIVRAFLPHAQRMDLQPLAGGLVHQSVKVNAEFGEYVLQRLNEAVFPNLQGIAANYRVLYRHLKNDDYSMQCPRWLTTIDGELLHRDSQGRYWRLCHYIQNAVSHESPPSPDYVRMAAQAYGKFLTSLRCMNVSKLVVTIPRFHDIDHRYEQFEAALSHARADRLNQASTAIDSTRIFRQSLALNLSALPLRVTHNDCKLSNLLFNENSVDVVAVIDWDTVMAGYVATDFGDMVRTLCNPATEEERDTSKVVFNAAHYECLEAGFVEATASWLSDAERTSLLDGARYIIFEQAIRFLSDYLAGDVYYPVSRDGHNLDRARNQLALLQGLQRCAC